MVKDVTSIRHNAVYVRLSRQADGVAVGRTAMPRLPSSWRKIWTDAGRSDITPFVSSTVKTIPTDLVMEGAGRFQHHRTAACEGGGVNAGKNFHARGGSE